MLKRGGVRVLLGVLPLMFVLPAQGAESETKTKWGEFEVKLRYRFEFVSDDNPALDEDGCASTLRTALLYRTPVWRGLDVFVEFEDVSDLGAGDKHDNLGSGSLSNGVADRPAIADPEDTEINQAAVRYQGVPDATFSVGRQEVNLGTQRFVGSVSWRQNYQILDAFRVVHSPTDRIAWTYLFVDNVNRVNGSDHGMAGNLASVNIEVREAGTLTPYVYLLDYDSPALFSSSTASYGARWRGRRKLGATWSLPYHVEIAQQDDFGDNPSRVDATYYNLEVGGARPEVWFKLALEVLGGSVEDGSFQTPLATLHKFNGWADKFLATPPTGLRDLFVSAGGKVGKVSLQGAFHDFRSDSESIDYGQELDVGVSYKSPWNQVFAFKVAAYDADAFSFDTFKAWIWTSYSF